MKADMAKVAYANERMQSDVHLDKKGGCSVVWSSFGGAMEAWTWVELANGVPATLD
jgi:hypothetical protein